MRFVRVLVVEDEATLAQLLSSGLREDGWQVDLAGRGEDAFRMARMGGYDAIVFDEMLPDLDSATACGRLRDSSVQARLLMLSVRDVVGDRVAALEAGADDYLVKPFALEELLARLRALVRRIPPQQTPAPRCRRNRQAR